MGVSCMGSVSHFRGGSYETYPKGQPNPHEFEILDIYPESPKFMKQTEQPYAVKVRYPNATNYEGVKILVFEKVSPATLRLTKFLDPHFSETGLAPIARFAPTKIGWALAKDLVVQLTEDAD